MYDISSLRVKDIRSQYSESNVAMRSALFWYNTRDRVVRNYHPHCTLCNIPKERIYHLHCGGSLKSHIMLGCFIQQIKTTSLQPFVIHLLQSVSDSKR